MEGIRCWFYGTEDKVYVYLDLTVRYYAFESDTLEEREDVDQDEIVIGAKCLVLW